MNQKEVEKLNKEIFDRVLNQKDEFINFYNFHSAKETMEKYGIRNEKQFRKILNSIDYDKNEKKKHNCLKGKKSTRTKESYIQGGLKSAKTQKDNWELKSDSEKEDWKVRCSEVQKSLSEEAKKNKINKYKETVSKKDKDVLLEENSRRSESCKNYWNKLKPQDREELIQIKNDKVKETCLNKYGVEYPCMLEEARMNGNNSEPNKAFETMLINYNINFTREFSIDNYSYDFKVGNILIEINPTYTHNSTINPFGRQALDKRYHFEKSKKARDNGFRCICVWDWDDKYKIIRLLLEQERIYARKCEIKEVSIEDAAKFINTYHLQNYAKDSIRIGLYYNDELVSIMTFGKPRYNNNYEYELIRYCSSKNIIGGAGKLFKYFKDIYKPSSIISYCDLSKFNGDTYEKLGFTLKNISISKHWFNGKKHITDNLLRSIGYDKLFNADFGKNTSNNELMLNNGFVEIYDCGQSTYIC